MSVKFYNYLKWRKKKSAPTDSLQSTAASLLELLQLYGTLRKNWKIKGKSEKYSLPFISKLSS